MVNVFEYTNYREIINDYYHFQQKQNHHFSFRVFSELCGFKDKSVVSNIIRGRINLTSGSAERVSRAMELKGPEREYFKILVSFNQAKTVDKKNMLFQKLESVKKQGIKTSPAQKIRKEQYEFYSRLYHSTIRSIIDMYPFKDDYKWLSKMVYPPIKPMQAKKSVLLLEKLGLIQKDDRGYYKVTDKNIKASQEVLDLGVANYHLDSAKLAKLALSVPSKHKKKMFAGQTLGLSEQAYRQVITEIEKFQDRLAKLATEDRGSDMVFQLNFQLFQTSGRDNKGEQS
jgi:uncharacterized protein (TIGR02147 family)